MSEKLNRWKKIREILKKETIPSQDILLQKLKKSGIICTQATLSRDLRELSAVKIPDSHSKFRITLNMPADHTTSQLPDKEITRKIDSVQFSGNLAVIKTMPGSASAIASHIDGMKIPGILGTVAGDDTIIIVMKNPGIAKKIKNLPF
jgi:transcriptional regulator of arginine metabolism